MGASALQLAAYWLKHRRFEKLHITTSVLIFVLGAMTLIFHKTIFIKWKPTIVYWLFSVILIGTHFIGSKKPLMHRMLKDKITLPAKVWSNLNISWAVFFLLLGCLNLYVVYNYSTNAWVYFKLFGTLGLMLVFILGQAFLYVKTHAAEEKRNL